MKRLFIVLLTFIFFNQIPAQTKNFIDQPHIEVNGYADTLVTPNEIYIRIIISEKDTRDKVSIEDQEKKMVEILKGLGIDTEKDLTTSDMLSNFRYYLLKSKDIIKSKSYQLKVTNATTASKVFIALEEIEVSNSSIEKLEHSDLDSLKNAMRTKAILDAQKRAISLTKPLGQTIGFAIHIVDEASLKPQVDNNTRIILRGFSSIQANNDYSKGRDLPKIDFEKIKISSTVNAKFIVK